MRLLVPRPWHAPLVGAFAAACISSLACVAWLPGCGGSTSDGGAPDSSNDSSGVDSTVEVSSDAAPETNRPRALIDVPFGDGVPTDDRLLDPLFEMSASAWFFYDPAGGASVHVEKRALARAPTGQFALFVPGRTATVNPSGVVVAGLLKLGNGAHDASIWIGSVDPTHAGKPKISILAVDASHPDGSVTYDFVVDDASAIDIDGVHWVAWKTSVDKGPLGFALLLAQISGASGTYLHAPIVRVHDATSPNLHPPAPARRASEVEARTAHLVFETTKRAPPKPPAPRLPTWSLP